jgi:ATP-dependent Clp protease ATP-binding subunit ClpA
MFERFTDRARKVMAVANQEAQRFNHEFVGPEHLLLGIVKDGACCASKIILAGGIDLRKVRLEVEKLLSRGADVATMGKLPHTPRAAKAIEFAMEEARSLDHNWVGTEHILLGLLREQDGVAAIVLDRLGLKIGVVRERAKGARADAEVPTTPDQPDEFAADRKLLSDFSCRQAFSAADFVFTILPRWLAALDEIDRLRKKMHTMIRIEEMPSNPSDRQRFIDAAAIAIFVGLLKEDADVALNESLEYAEELWGKREDAREEFERERRRLAGEAGEKHGKENEL